MTVMPLVDRSDPILREVMPEFDFQDQKIKAVTLSHDLVESMLKEDGLGLSACQIGLRLRAFCMLSNPIIVCFNPKIVDKSEEQAELLEGCLSFPGLFLNIKRAKKIRVRFTMPNGDVTTQIYDGMTARIFQHEIDHLNGILFTDHVSKLKLDMAIKKARKIREL